MNILRRPVREARVLEVGDAETVAARISEKRVTAGIERPNATVVSQRGDGRIVILQTLWNVRLAAADSRAVPVDQVLAVGADRDAAAGVIPAEGALDGGQLAAADDGELVDVGEGEGGAAEVDPDYVEEARLLAAGAVEAGGGDYVLDSEVVVGDVDDFDVGGGDEKLGRVEGGAAVDVEPWTK